VNANVSVTRLEQSRVKRLGGIEVIASWSARQRGRRERLTQDDGVGGEDGEVRMQLVEEVKLVGGAADGSGEEEDVALQPRDLGRRVLEADTWTWFGHDVLVQLA